MWATVKRQIELHASSLAKKYGNSNTAHVDVHEIAKKLGLSVFGQDLGAVSGVLYIEKGKGIIGYNKNESPVRQRFTIAHEIGHYILHRLDNDIFVDQQTFSQVLYRNNDSAKGEIRHEREANAFAAALLMPRERIIAELEKMPFDLADGDEDAIKTLADEFMVSTQAMLVRVSNLNLF